MIEEVYKIVDKDVNGIYTLFHGIKGKKKLPYDKWLMADKKMVKDGSGGKLYLSGIHCFKTQPKANKYLDKFKYIEKKTIIKINAINLRQKPTNNDVWLADGIYISSKNAD